MSRGQADSAGAWRRVASQLLILSSIKNQGIMSAVGFKYAPSDTEYVLADIFFHPRQLELLKQNREFFRALGRAKTAADVVEVVRRGERLIEAQPGLG